MEIFSTVSNNWNYLKNQLYDVIAYLKKLHHQNVELTPANNCAKFHSICINSKKKVTGGRNQPTELKVLKKSPGYNMGQNTLRLLIN